VNQTWQTSRWFATICCIYLLLFSIAAWMMIALGGPSFWYAPCAALLFLSALLWLNPRRGASSSLPFLLAFVVPLISLRVWDWPGQRWTAVLSSLALLLALGMCVAVVSVTRLAVRWFTLSFALIALSFATDRLFTNKVQIRTLQMSYSLDGRTPWADDTQRDAQGKPPVLVFVRTSDGYCYDAVFYQPLIDKLKSTHLDEVQVQYNLFSDFGKERSYNIRSVAGVMLNDENHEIVQHDGYGGTIESPLQGAQKSVPAQCPR
jgi:hypothetical protein